MSIIDKIASGGNRNGVGEFTVEGGEFQEEYPGLFEVLARDKSRGKDRQTGRLVMYTEIGKAVLCLCDRETGQVCFYAADGLSEALRGLERALQAGSADWRRDKREAGRRS